MNLKKTSLGVIEELLIFVKKIMFCLIGLVVAITGLDV